MTTDLLLQKMLTNTYTKSDCYRRLTLVQDFLESALYGGGSLKTDWGMALEARYSISDDADHATAIAAWGSDWIGSLAGPNLSSGLEALRAALAHVPELILYVPTKLGSSQTVTIGQWCRSAFAKQVLRDLHIHTNAAGVCAFARKGVLYDFSLSYFSSNLISRNNSVL